MRVVLVRLSALGDIVHTWPLAEAIRDARPEAHLTWVVERPLIPLVEGHPAIDAVLPVATRPWRKHPLANETRAEVGRLRSRLHELQPDLAIDPQGVLKSALVTRWSAAPARVGLAMPWRRERLAGFAYTSTIAGSRTNPHVVATNLELVRAVGGSPPADPAPPDGRWLLDRGASGAANGSPREGFGVLFPGAGQPGKILPAPTLAAAARHLVARGLDAVVAWGPSERDRASEIAELGGAGVRLAPPTDLVELARLLGRAAVVVGGDTGPIHLAASLAVPTLAVFLNTDPARNGPLGERVAVVSGAAPAAGPRGSATTRPLRAVEAPQICAALDELLAGASEVVAG